MSDTREVHVEWLADSRFRVESSLGVETLLDGDRKAALSPMENLLGSLATCMGIDVVMILQKMRVDLRGLKMTLTGERNPEPPKFYRKIEFAFAITGDVPQKKAERAVSLSFEKYCSVFHTLRKDLVVDSKVRVEKGES